VPETRRGPKQGPIAAVAGRYFDRIVAQTGTFTVDHYHRDLETMEGGSVFRVRIPSTAKPSIRAELSDMNVNASTVYPDLAHLAEHVRELYTT
jgi:hypothetical protein